MVNETNGKCFLLWGVFVIMFIYPFKIELFNFCEEFLWIASLNSRLLINITAGCFFFLFGLFCGSWDTAARRLQGTLKCSVCFLKHETHAVYPKSHTSTSKHQCGVQFSTLGALISARVSVVPKSRTAIFAPAGSDDG